MMKPALLFVCLGNICRSPLAQGAFREAARAAGLDALSDSCGTAAYHVGSPPDPRSIDVAAANAVDISDLRGRQLVRTDYTRFTHIFAMDHENLRNIHSMRPTNSTAHIALLMDEINGREGEAIADPYYGGNDQFENTWRDVELAAKALVAKFS